MRKKIRAKRKIKKKNSCRRKVQKNWLVSIKVALIQKILGALPQAIIINK